MPRINESQSTSYPTHPVACFRARLRAVVLKFVFERTALDEYIIILMYAMEKQPDEPD